MTWKSGFATRRSAVRGVLEPLIHFCLAKVNKLWTLASRNSKQFQLQFSRIKRLLISYYKFVIMLLGRILFKFILNVFRNFGHSSEIMNKVLAYLYFRMSWCIICRFFQVQNWCRANTILMISLWVCWRNLHWVPWGLHPERASLMPISTLTSPQVSKLITRSTFFLKRN